MRVAYISDLHLEYRQPLVSALIDDNFEPFKTIGFPDELEADVLVIAGDIHEGGGTRSMLKRMMEKRYGIPVIMPLGNHDFYRGPFPTDAQGDIMVIDGVTIAWATLWSHLSPMDEIVAPSFPDFKFITGITVAQWNYAHQNQLAFLRATKADIIATHHAPCRLSIGRNFEGDSFNPFFTTDLDLELFPKCKLWIHGHVHDPFDYTVDGLRIVCNPLGYPFEKKGRPPITVQVIEV